MNSIFAQFSLNEKELQEIDSLNLIINNQTSPIDSVLKARIKKSDIYLEIAPAKSKKIILKNINYLNKVTGFNKKYLAESYLILSDVYNNKKSYDSSLIYCKKALDISLEKK